MYNKKSLNFKIKIKEWDKRWYDNYLEIRENEKWFLIFIFWRFYLIKWKLLGKLFLGFNIEGKKWFFKKIFLSDEKLCIWF